METKTCPHCNEVSTREYMHDINFESWCLEGWCCTDCGRIFFTDTEETEEEKEYGAYDWPGAHFGKSP